MDEKRQEQPDDIRSAACKTPAASCGTDDGKLLAAACPNPHRMTVGAGQATIAGSVAGAVPTHLLNEGEQIILAIKPSLWFIVFHSAPRIIILGLFLIGLKAFFPTDTFDSWSRTIYQIISLLILAQLVASTLQWISRLYVLTDRRIMRIRGVFSIEIFECLLVKIQNTYLTLAWYERLLGLGSIFFATAGTAGIEAAWTNINQPLDVHELVRKAIRDAQTRWPNGQP
jgi:hypothetical protein